jgi:alanine-glyoxylate transaminase / serine-glyoxylate transaminase / serine-pyruvate transaminase
LSGRHFLQIPGPSNVPDSILHEIASPTIDHRSAEFAELGKRVLAGMKRLHKTADGHVFIYPGSGTGAWEAALVNTLSPGDKALMCDSGHFASLWARVAQRVGVEPVLLDCDWRTGIDLNAIHQALENDVQKNIRAVCVVHNETSTGCTAPIQKVRQVLDSLKHPALLMVDAISSLGSIDLQMDNWQIDVSVSGSQKGLMLPPGLCFVAASQRALERHQSARCARSYWDWSEMLKHNVNGFFPYTPASTLLAGLARAITLIEEEGLNNVFARHARHAAATRRAVRAWGLELFCADDNRVSNVLTAVLMPDGHSADRLRAIILEKFNMSLGAGLSKLSDRVFRIGHLGSFNDLMLVGTLGGIEMGLKIANVPFQSGALIEALAELSKNEILEA